ncbi:putative chromosome transmission fidelity protein 18 protein [Phaeoacremonium minimum UCRPA7]|uniref:Putative chromosome transmission fidelity protein 18 protein n=1 Tax=Phaeoacremonium minimum (strain UCR-PA7) TaxID=1286976 RepID=R8BE60_PHAM7|nr:putative chromosome transmission fidelity protein 18 protein [Phaeoacremonium minimum UCRPA7]EON97593.1 putative chromosome transmission fidelity protein 18 protein [Phaeoacremonium minimum UCRPA7]
MKAGFLDDDDDSDKENEDDEPVSKKLMLKDPREDALQEIRQTGSREGMQAMRNDDSMEIPDAQPAESLLTTEETRYELLFGTSQADSFVPSRLPSAPRVSSYRLSTCSGKSLPIRQRKATTAVSYESMVAARSRTKEGRAKRAYYGIDIHRLMDNAAKEASAKAEAKATAQGASNKPIQSLEESHAGGKRSKRSLLWTEKYRARNFTDLVGDDLTNRQVLRWLKRWDTLVFPHAVKERPHTSRRPGASTQQEEEKPHRKILMLTGPPGLGKTTLAHVCARQAGYEVLEINASDDRSRDVVKGRIRTSLGTESVKTVEQVKPAPGKKQKIARPVCVVVDEVDGVVTGSGGSGEGGFIKALIDLIMLDQKNASTSSGGSSAIQRRKKKGDDFRQMRPLILICNDVYHPSLKPLRHSGLAEIIHVGKPSIDAVVTRLKTVFEKEGIPCEKDAARKLCEAAWGMSSGIDAKKGAESAVEGDLRGVMVVGEWVATRLKATVTDGSLFLTRQWIEKNVMHDLAHGGGGSRGLGRGSVKDIVTRIFQDGAGFPKQADVNVESKNTHHEQPQTQLGFAEHHKKYAMGRLREMIETSGDVDRIMTEVFSEYPNREFNDDSYLTKPDTAYEWMHFHDACSSRLYSSQEWELAPYLSQPALACHHLFAAPIRRYANAGYEKQWRTAEGDANADSTPLPFTGPRADFSAYEMEKQNRSVLQSIQSNLPPSLARSFRSPEHVATDFLPYLVRLVSPDVKPVVVGGSGDKGISVASVRREGEKIMVHRAAEVLAEVGISLVKGKIEEANPSMANRTQWVYRMDPDLDALSAFETAGAHVLATQAPTRYAVRQVLDQELHKTIALRETAARQARFKAGNPFGAGYDEFVVDEKENVRKWEAEKKLLSSTSVKKDFFGRIIQEKPRPLQDLDVNSSEKRPRTAEKPAAKVWVTFHEGLNNAVKKPITLDEFLRGL